ncbi:hypothetical protein [Streptomyces ardesiacus]|uniref:hypothetical protein n=1 Tax=Streptomyces ardesiacus TaxID=285564 RepID=UPI00381206F8
MTLHEHAKAIQDAIQAAYEDGFELDNGDGDPIYEMDLNDWNGSDWHPIALPSTD